MLGSPPFRFGGRLVCVTPRDEPIWFQLLEPAPDMNQGVEPRAGEHPWSCSKKIWWGTKFGTLTYCKGFMPLPPGLVGLLAILAMSYPLLHVASRSWRGQGDTLKGRHVHRLVLALRCLTSPGMDRQSPTRSDKRPWHCGRVWSWAVGIQPAGTAGPALSTCEWTSRFLKGAPHEMYQCIKLSLREMESFYFQLSSILQSSWNPHIPHAFTPMFWADKLYNQGYLTCMVKTQLRSNFREDI